MSRDASFRENADSPLTTTQHRIFALCALLFSCGLLWQADSQLKWLDGKSFHEQPGFWSVVALIGMTVFSALALFQRPATVATPRSLQWSSHVRQWLGPVEYAIYFLVYVYAVPHLGYLPATLLVFSLIVLRIGYRSMKMMLCTWIVGFSIVVLFKSLLQVKIPGGAIYAFFPESMRNFFIINF